MHNNESEGQKKKDAHHESFSPFYLQARNSGNAKEEEVKDSDMDMINANLTALNALAGKISPGGPASASAATAAGTSNGTPTATASKSSSEVDISNLKQAVAAAAAAAAAAAVTNTASSNGGGQNNSVIEGGEKSR